MLEVGLGALVLVSARPAVAGPMDPSLSRLVIDAACASGAGPCEPDRAAYHKLVSQWGFALAPQASHEARTIGLAGFGIALTGAVTGIDADADYWRLGTRGEGDLGGSGARRSEPPAVLQLYSMAVRKGFGFGIEAAGSIGVVPETSLVALGADLRVALLEGMRDGFFGYLPDTSLGLGLRNATGWGELSLRTLSLELRFSRRLIAPAGFIITPWIGYQWLRIDADSALVDLTPATDPLRACGYVGANIPGMPGADGEVPDAVVASGAPPSVFDGAPICRTSGADDFGSSVSFGEADLLRHRVLLGVSYRQQVLELGLQLLTDLIRPDAAQSDAATATALRCDASGDSCAPAPRQWTLALQIGAVF